LSPDKIRGKKDNNEVKIDITHIHLPSPRPVPPNIGPIRSRSIAYFISEIIFCGETAPNQQLKKPNMAKYVPEKSDKEDGVLTDVYKGLANFFKSRDLFCGEHDGSIADFSKLNKTLSDLADYKEIFEHKCWNLSSGAYVAGFILGGGLLIAPVAFLTAPGLAAWLGSTGILGAAGTGTLISTLHGAALASASLAAIGPAGMLGGSICITAAGAALGGVTGGMISNSYYGDIKDFSIKKLQGGHGPAILFINGFLSANENDFHIWEKGVLKKFPDNPLYGVTWESKALKDLGLMGADGILALAAAAAKAALKKGANPVKILAFVPFLGDLVANPWHVAVSKAEQVGILLADLIA
jgi:hypothetical protein